jgi:hypothetical protein
VIASVTLIGACMAMLSPEAEASGRWAAPVPEAAPAANQLPPSASRNTRVRSASAG